MKKIYNARSKSALYYLFLGTLAVSSWSCVDETYSIDKEIEMDMNIGGSLTLPLGSTSQIKLGDMLKDAGDLEMLEELAGGDYTISMNNQIEIDLTELSEISVILDEISEPINIAPIALNTPTLATFDIAGDPQNIEVAPSTIEIDKGDSTPINETINISPELGSIFAIPAGVPITNTNIPIALASSDPIGVNVDFEYPDQVKQVSKITFSSTASISLDASNLKARFGNDFELSLAYIEITFPEGFYLDGTTSNSVRRTALEADANGIITMEYTIDSYNKTLVNNGTPLSIGGDITFDIAPEITISGTTSGATPSSDELTLKILNDVSVDDAEVEVEGIEIPIDAVENLGSPVKIDLDNLITAISSVSLAAGHNAIDIEIDPISSLPTGLSTGSAEYLTITFPRSKYIFASHADMTTTEELYQLNIPVSSVVEGAGYSTSIAIEKILFSAEDYVAGTDTEVPYVNFDPQIATLAATVTLGGDISLSDYDSYTSSTSTITASFSGMGLEVETAQVTTAGYTADIDPVNSEIAISESIPAEIERIYSLTFADRVYLNVDVEVDITGTDADLSFKDYTIEFPKFIQFADDVPVTFDPEKGVNVMTINDTFDKVGDTRKFSRKFEVLSLDFTDEGYKDIITGEGNSKTLNLDETISLAGSLSLEGGEVDSSSLPETVAPQISYSLDAITVDKVYGVLNPEIPSEPTTIDLSEIGEAFSGDLSLVLSSPGITFTATNSLEIPVEISTIKLTPTKGGEPIETQNNEGETITTEVEMIQPIIIAAAKNGVSTSTKINVVPDGQIPTSTNGESYVEMKNLKYLLSGLPDKVEISYEAAAIQIDNEPHMIDLDRDEPYEFTLDYDLSVPLRFDSLYIDYESTMRDLGESLATAFDYVSSLEVNLEVENTMPLALQISKITPVDKQGDEITSLDPLLKEGENTILANSSSSLKLSLRDNEYGDLKKIDGFNIYIDATIDYVEGGSQINADQYLVIKMSATLPDGIYIDADEAGLDM